LVTMIPTQELPSINSKNLVFLNDVVDSKNLTGSLMVLLKLNMLPLLKLQKFINSTSMLPKLPMMKLQKLKQVSIPSMVMLRIMSRLILQKQRLLLDTLLK